MMGFNFGRAFDAILVDRETGEEVGNLNTSVMNLEYSDEFYSGGNGNRFIDTRKTYTVTLENATINHDVFDKLVSIDENKKFRIIGKTKELQKLEFIQKRTRNRRIKNKVKNKIENKYSHPLYSEGIMVKAKNISLV